MMKKKKKGKCLRMAPFAKVIRERTERGRIVLCFVPFLFDFFDILLQPGFLSRWRLFATSRTTKINERYARKLGE